MHPYAYKKSGKERRGEREIWCGSEPIICTNLFGLIDATAARFVSSFWLPHKVAACGAPKNLLNISTSAAVSAEENPPKKKKKKPGQQGLPGQQWELASCVYQMLVSFSVFSFFCFVPKR